MNRRNLLKGGLAGLAAVTFLRPTDTFAADGPASSAAKFIKLSSNENPYGFSAGAKQALLDSIADGNRYASPDLVNKLEQEIAAREGLKAENVVLGTGSGEVLCMAAIAFGQGEIVAPDPTFQSLMRYAEALGAKIKNVPINEKFEHDFDAMTTAVSAATSLVYVCNPNNPTASLSPKNDLLAFCRETARKVTVFADEAYLEYTDDFPRNSLVELVRKGENIIVSRTFSKIYGMAGLRVGYGLARTDIAQKLKRFRMTWFNNPSLSAALAALADQDFIAESRRKNNEVRRDLMNELDRMKLAYAPSAANFLWVKTGPESSNLGDKMRERNILLGNPRNNWARITIGTRDEMSAFVKAFKEIRG
jgi:histidinol-phosphate aminotransferase